MSDSSRIIAEKQQRLYQQQFEQQHKQLSVKQLIEFILRINIDNDSLFPALRDGRILCRLMNTFHQPADFIHFSDFEPLPKFKQIENIQLFLKKCRLYVSEDQLFHPNDLLESANLQQVLNCLIALFEYFQDYIKNDLYNMNYYNAAAASGIIPPRQANNNASDYYYNANGGISYFYPYYNDEQQQSSPSSSSPPQQNDTDTYNHDQSQFIIPKKGLNGYILDAIIGTRNYILAPFFICVALGFGIKMSRTTFVKISDLVSKYPPSSIQANIITPTLNKFSTESLKLYFTNFNTYIISYINQYIINPISSFKLKYK